MAKTIGTIEIAIEQATASTKTVKAVLILEGKNSYVATLLKPDGSSQSITVHADSDEPATLLLIQKLKGIVDDFDPSTTTVKVLIDSLNLLPKVTYRCPNPSCQA